MRYGGFLPAELFDSLPNSIPLNLTSPNFGFCCDDDLLLRRDLRPEPVHIFSELGKPVLRISVIRSVPAPARFLVADDVLRANGRIVLHQPFAKVSGKPESFLEILPVVQRVLGYLYLDIRRIIVVTSLRAAPAAPQAPSPFRPEPP